MFLSFFTDVYVIFLHWNILMKCTHFIFICHLLFTDVDIFLCENVPEFQYCFWLITDVDYFSCVKCFNHCQLMFMWFSCTETYWWSGCTSSSFLSFTDVDIFLCLKCSTISILLLIIYWCWLFFMCKMFFIILDWCLCDFLVLTRYWWSGCTSSSFVIYWCWHIFVFKMFHNFSIAFDYLLMLTTFHTQNVLIIVDWCLCDFLVLKHINKFYTVHLHFCHLLMLIYFWYGKYSRISVLLLIIYWCWLLFMHKMFLSLLTDVYVIFLYWNISINSTQFIFIFVIYWCWHIFVWKIFQNFNIGFDYLLMLIIFHVQNVLIIFDRCLCDFLVLKHINEVDALHLHLSFTDVDIFLCLKCSTISVLLLIIYWCWLFFMCKMFLSFFTDVYVIFLHWNISIKWMHFIFICHLLMLIYFCV